MTRDENAAVASLSLERIAELVEGRVEGDPAIRVTGVAPIRDAGPGELGFLADARYTQFTEETGAAALLVSKELSGPLSSELPMVVADDPHLALGLLLGHLHPPDEAKPGVHPTAVLGKGVRLGADVEVGPYAVLGKGVEVGDRVRIGAHVAVGSRCRIGDDSVLHPHVVLYPGTVLGLRVVLHAGVKAGVDGFGYVYHEGEHRKVPQVGGCIIEDDVEVGANCCIDRGSIGRTRIGAGSKLDNLVHLAHNVDVGSASLLVAQVGIAGSARLGKGVQVGGQAGIGGHLEIGEGARVGAQSGVTGNVAPGETIFGTPARKIRDYMRGIGMALSHPDLGKRVKELEKKLARLEGEGG